MLIGIDVGGTKTAVRVSDSSAPDKVHHDRVVPTKTWQQQQPLGDRAAAARLLETAYGLGARPSDPLVVGAHGCDSPALIQQFVTALQATHLGPLRAINDAFLVPAAGGFTDAIGVIVGTGSIVVGQLPDGSSATAGGYGWLLGDPGSAPGLTREAVKLVLARRDVGDQPDALARELMATYHAPSVDDLVTTFTDSADIHRWASGVHAVFAAESAGSIDARQVITEAGHSLGRSVRALLNRGVAARAVVAGGGVIINQPSLQRALQDGLSAANVSLPCHILADEPVVGAIVLAQSLDEHTEHTTKKREHQR